MNQKVTWWLRAIFAAAMSVIALCCLTSGLSQKQGRSTSVPRFLLPSAAAPAVTESALSASSTPSPHWIIRHHGTCCEGNLAAQGPSTYLLLPVLVNGNKILRSDDGGQNWVQKYPPVDASAPYGIEGDLQAFGNNVDFFGTLLAQGVAAHSSDRGETWTVVPIQVPFVANDQAWSYLGPYSVSPAQTAPYVLAGWYRIGSVVLFSLDGGLTWPIQTPLVGDDGSGPSHIVCQQTAHAPTSPGDTRIADQNFVNHKAGRHGAWGTDKKFYWTETSNGTVSTGSQNLYVCKTDNFGATWTGIKHQIAPGGGLGYVVTHTAFDNNGTLYVLHGDQLYVSFNQGEDVAFVHTIPRYGNAGLSDSGADQFFVVSCGTVHIGLITPGPNGNNDVYYLRGAHVDTATPTWDEEFVDSVASDRLDFFQIVLNGNGVPTLSYTTPGTEVTTASRDAPLDGGSFCNITPVSVVSRKIHGGAGPFDINLPLTGVRGVECRGSGSVNDYTLIFTFSDLLTSVAGATVTTHNPSTGTGSVSSSMIDPGDKHKYIVNVTNVSTAQYIRVALNTVIDATGKAGNVVSPEMGVLVGDVSANGVVTNTDVGAVKAQVNPTVLVTQVNFRDDVSTNGFVTNTDVGTTKAQVNPGGGLPSPP